MSFSVLVGYDVAEHCYYVLESAMPGLHVETRTFEEFVEVTKDFAPDLIGELPAGAKIEFRREVALASWRQSGIPRWAGEADSRVGC